MTENEVKTFIKLYIDLSEMNLENIQIIRSFDDTRYASEVLIDMIKNTESMLDILKIINRTMKWKILSQMQHFLSF